MLASQRRDAYSEDVLSSKAVPPSTDRETMRLIRFKVVLEEDVAIGSFVGETLGGMVVGKEFG